MDVFTFTYFEIQQVFKIEEVQCIYVGIVCNHKDNILIRKNGTKIPLKEFALSFVAADVEVNSIGSFGILRHRTSL